MKEHSELPASGEVGWTREAMADRCLQRPCCTSAWRRERDFLCISLCSCFSSWPPCPLRGKCGECRSLLWRRNPNTRLPCQPPWPPTLSRWPGSISPGALGLVVPVWAPSRHPPHRFLPTSVCVLVLDCPSFTANGFLSAPRSSRLLSSYPRPDADRVKAVILENWVRRGGKCVRCLWGREIQSFLSTS